MIPPPMSQNKVPQHQIPTIQYWKRTKTGLFYEVGFTYSFKLLKFKSFIIYFDCNIYLICGFSKVIKIVGQIVGFDWSEVINMWIDEYGK